VELAIEAMCNIDKFDKIVLVSGSKDFLPLCEKFVLNNKRVEIVSFYYSIHTSLRKYDIRYLDHFLQI